MTEMKIELTDDLAEVVERRAETVGVSPDQWLSLMVADLVADVPEGGDGPDDWIGR
jgi:hypothetical protein